MNIASKAMLAATLCLCPCVLPVSSKTHAKLPQQGLVEETPKFDLGLSKYSFQLGIEQNEFNRVKRKPILQARLQLLRGGTQAFQLRAAEQGARLQAQRAKNGALLHGAVDKNGKPLTAKADENPLSPLKTNERVHSPFQLDIRQLTASVAPDIVFQMDQEISQARNRSVDEIAKRENAMDPRLRADAPQPEMPNPNASITATRELESQMEKIKQSGEQAARQAGEALKLAMAGGERAPAKMPGDGMGGAPKIPATAPERAANSTKATEAEREMSAELMNAQSRVPPSASEFDGKLADANGQAKANVAAAKPDLDAILTHVHPIPGTSFPSVPKSASPGDTSDVVPWDEWHAQFARLADGPILKSVSKTKRPSGFDTVQITVWRNHRLDAKITKASSAEFDQAILQAYKSLNGNPGLTFPKNSQRKSITFLVDNEHKGAGAPSSVQSQTSVGDREVIRYHI